MSSKRILTAALFFLSLPLSGLPSSAQATTPWTNAAIATQTGTFTVTFTAVPTQNDEDLVFGLSPSPATAYSGIATIVRFNDTGTIDVRNGANYVAQNSVPYTAGVSYGFTMLVNVPAHTYSVSVTPAGKFTVVLATNYAFRSEEGSATSLSYRSEYGDVGGATISNFTIVNPVAILSNPSTSPAPTSIASNAFNVSSPANGATVSATKAITGTAGSQWVNVHAYTSGGASLTGDVTPSNGSYSLSLNTVQLANGTNSINVVAFSVPAGQSGGTSSTVALSLNVQNTAAAPAACGSTPSGSTVTKTLSTATGSIPATTAQCANGGTQPTTTVVTQLYLCTNGTLSTDGNSVSTTTNTGSPSCSAQPSVPSNTFTVTSPANGATKSGTITISGTAGSQWVNVHAYTSGGTSLTGDVTPSTNGSYTLSLNTTQLANGTNSISVTAFSVPAGQSGGTSATVALSLNIQNAASSTSSAGACGSANGEFTNAAPTSNLCSAGTASAVSGNGPWTWSCAGSNGGVTAMCSASLPACGSAPINSSYQLVFDDEFNGTSQDTTKWSTGWFGSGITSNPNPSIEEECYDPAQVTVNNGLNLTAIAKQESCGVTSPQYASGMITTNGLFQFTYGYFEALIYLPPSGTEIANWPAFWADGTGTWPTTGEMDIMEGLSGQACSHFHDPDGGPGFCATGNYSGWHIYAGWWTPGAVNYYYDNQLVGTITEGITSAPMYLILNNAMSAPNDYGGPTVAPADMQVKWVHVYSNAAGTVPVAPEPGYAGPGGSTNSCN